MVTLKTPAEIALMREAGRIVAETLALVSEAAAPGVRLVDLDELAADNMRRHGAKSSFLHYHPNWAPMPYPGVLCVSVNDVIVHGIPGKQKLRDGDIVSIDFGVEVEGYHGDAAVTALVGEVDKAAVQLVDTTRAALDAAIAACVVGGRLSDIGHAVEKIGRAAGYGILENHGGHGIGRAMHEDPHVPNTGSRGRGMKLREGLVLALEPMFSEGGSDTYRTLDDGWSIATDDKTRAAHWEHTVAITADGPQILTLP